MEAIFEDFLINLVNDVPSYMYEMLLSVSCLMIAIFFATFKREKAFNYSFRLLFWEYVFLIYCFTVFFRSKINDIWHNFSPFWSYRAYYTGEYPSLLPEIIMNIIGFIPLGILMGVSYPKLKWWQVVSTGFIVSISIESIQYFFMLGIAEFDDVFNNTLGVATGYAIFYLTNFLSHKIIRNQK